MHRKFIGLLALSFLATSAVAQDSSAIDDLEPAVVVSADEIVTSTAQSAEDTLPRSSRRVIANDGVMDELDLDRTEITGNQELPKVLYIVPWQKSEPGDLIGKPANTLLDEILAPIDRSEFVRQIRYYEDLQED
ncbi:MAG: hypothetical protein HKN35_09405 [Woeseia sp.]|nr:hypothetical protein [Woeseia sp.]